MNNLLQGINVYLIGMMGTGKTTVGKILAPKLNYLFFDTDVLIEKVADKTINQIFAIEGENEFRELESKVLAELSSHTKSVVATGGGIIKAQKNWGYLHYGLIVWLDAPYDLIIQRLAQDDTRPLLQEDPGTKIRSLLEDRRPLYSQADLHINIEASQTPEEIASQIINKIPNVLKEKPVS